MMTVWRRASGFLSSTDDLTAVGDDFLDLDSLLDSIAGEDGWINWNDILCIQHP
jgi:hypothetical protein